MNHGREVQSFIMCIDPQKEAQSGSRLNRCWISSKTLLKDPVWSSGWSYLLTGDLHIKKMMEMYCVSATMKSALKKY